MVFFLKMVILVFFNVLKFAFRDPFLHSKDPYNPTIVIPQELVENRGIADTLDYTDVVFPVSEKDYCKIEDNNDICVNVFPYEGTVIYPIYVSEKDFDNCLNLLMIHEGNRSLYVYIKDFNRLMFNKTENKNKKWFCMHCLQCFSSENVLNKHKENCLVINGTQRVKKLSEGSINLGIIRDR